MAPFSDVSLLTGTGCATEACYSAGAIAAAAAPATAVFPLQPELLQEHAAANSYCTVSTLGSLCQQGVHIHACEGGLSARFCLLRSNSWTAEMLPCRAEISVNMWLAFVQVASSYVVVTAWALLPAAQIGTLSAHVTAKVHHATDYMRVACENGVHIYMYTCARAHQAQAK